jgi:general secretion pathway protein K
MTGQRGVALIIVLWVTMLLALMVESFLAEVRTDTLLARNLVDNGEAQALADGVIHQTVERLLKQRQSEDTYFDGQWTKITLEGGMAEVAIQDESGKVNLNTAPDALLEAVFLSAGVDIGHAKSLVDRIADWRDSDHLRRLNGAEDSDYRAAGLPYGAKDLPFASVDELQMVLGVTPNIHSRLATALTVYADRRGVDLRVAPRPVLQALMDNNDARVNVFLDARQ